MNWLEFHITTTSQHADQLNNQLILLGAQSITLRDGANQPIFEPPLNATPMWEEVLVVALFDDKDPIESIGTYLEKQRDEGLLKKFELRHFPDEDWLQRCRDSFKPMCFGKRLWVCPSWSIPPDSHALNIVLDPGLAFGTGTHPTTALCLEWLDENLQTDEVVLDYGCGSGILALAALKLGARKVYAVDHDPQAIESAKKNAERNNIAPDTLFFTTPIEPVDVLLANILAQPLIEFAPLFAKLLKKNGKLIISGILSNQVEAVEEAYKPWFNIEKPLHREDWVRVSATRNAATSQINK